MGQLSHLEHEGNELFLGNRKTVEKVKEKIKAGEKSKEQEIEDKNKEWNSIDNPALWDGEI